MSNLAISLATKHLIKRFGGVHAVDHLSVSFEPGKITAVIGPNGSGKSTLINTLTGMLEMDGGEVIVAETTRLSRIRPHEIAAYGITRTFQDVRLFEQMPVIDNLLLTLTERSVWSAFFERHSAFHLEEAEALLRRVGLYDKRHELAVNLSYGQRKLLEIARTLAMKADIYLYDEPYAGLFPEMVKLVSSVMKDLRAAGKTVVLIEHNMDLIRELADTVFVLDAGKLLAHGAPHDVLSRREVIEAYLGE